MNETQERFSIIRAICIVVSLSFISVLCVTPFMFYEERVVRSWSIEDALNYENDSRFSILGNEEYFIFDAGGNYSRVDVAFKRKLRDSLTLDFFFQMNDKDAFNEDTYLRKTAGAGALRLSYAIGHGVNGRNEFSLRSELKDDPVEYIDSVYAYQKVFVFSWEIVIAFLLFLGAYSAGFLLITRITDSLGRLLGVMLFLELLYYIVCFATNGAAFDSIFFGDYNDTFGDFFKPLFDWHGSPWKDAKNANYPALAMLFYKLCYHFVPKIFTLGDGLAYRGVSAAWIIFIVSTVVVIWFIIISLEKLVDISNANRKVLFLVLALSAPVMHGVERGNMVVWISFALTIYYIAYYKASNPVVKESAMLALAIASGLRLYPAIFGLLMIKKGEKKAVARLIIYGMVFFFVPFLFYGLPSFGVWVKTLREMMEQLLSVYGYNYSIRNMANILAIFCGDRMSNIAYWVMFIVFVSGLAVGALFSNDRMLRTLSCVLLGIIVPAQSFEYGITFTIIPFCFFIGDYAKRNIVNTTYSITWFALFFVGLYTPWFGPVISPLSRHGWLFTYSYVLYYLMIYLMVVYVGKKNMEAIWLKWKERKSFDAKQNSH